MPKPTVLIIGGGAAGLSAAIAAARIGAAVTVLEAKARVGSKILATGNGRCNLSHCAISPAAYNAPEFVGPVLSAYSSREIVSFFEGLGLMTYADEDGRIYPLSNNASSVLDVLRLECARLGVETICDFEVVAVSQLRSAGGFNVRSSAGLERVGDALIVTTGGGNELLADLGHPTKRLEPVLVPIRTETEPIRGLSGVRVRCRASIYKKSDVRDATCGSTPVAAERGEMLFRDYGVSGIMAFDLSRYLEQDCILSLDLLPDIALTDLVGILTKRRETFSSRAAETFLTGIFHARVSAALLRAAHIRPKSAAVEIPCERLAGVIKGFELSIVGPGDAKQAQVTRGGASVDAFSPTTLESRRIAGLFAAGEVLDVDGRCGGYNLHWAWSSGIVAGQYAAQFSHKGIAPQGADQ